MSLETEIERNRSREKDKQDLRATQARHNIDTRTDRIVDWVKMDVHNALEYLKGSVGPFDHAQAIQWLEWADENLGILQRLRSDANDA